MLEVTEVSAGYGQLVVLRGVNLALREGSITSIVGANGAGKSTLLRTISGLIRPTAGRVAFRGQRIDGLRPHEIARRGMSHVPEGRQLFVTLTVEDNLLLGGKRVHRDRASLNLAMEDIFGLFPVLKDRRRQKAGSLSGGEQQMLAIGRGLISQPALMLMDEPSLGLAPKVIDLIFQVITRIKASGVTILLVEQNARFALDVSDDAYIMQNGELLAAAGGSEYEEFLRQSYLG